MELLVIPISLILPCFAGACLQRASLILALSVLALCFVLILHPILVPRIMPPVTRALNALSMGRDITAYAEVFVNALVVVLALAPFLCLAQEIWKLKFGRTVGHALGASAFGSLGLVLCLAHGALGSVLINVLSLFILCLALLSQISDVLFPSTSGRAKRDGKVFLRDAYQDQLRVEAHKARLRAWRKKKLNQPPSEENPLFAQESEGVQEEREFDVVSEQ